MGLANWIVFPTNLATMKLRSIVNALVVFTLSAPAALAADAPLATSFETVTAILKTHCVKCHGPTKQAGKLNLALPAGIARGGESGAAIVPGKPEESLLWQQVDSNDMPKDEDPLSADDKAHLRRWIASGAPGLPAKVVATPNGDEHWAFQKSPTVKVPTVQDASRVRTPIDAFIQSRLEASGLTLGPEANRETLIRRVAFDLTGLPPTLEEIDAFVSDGSVYAYEGMVERYMASPTYGERWGKYWLDAAGYADSNGYFNADTDRPLAYRYRDYVIRATNADKPWDQFIREQLAGDELAGYRRGGDVKPEMVELLEAVHFLRNSPDGTDSSDGNADEVRADKFAVLEGTLQIVGSSLLGITVQCARCHDHKFEPFTQRDYYRLQAVIYPAFNVDQWTQPKGRDISTATAAEQTAWDAQVKQVDAQIAQRRQAFAEWTKQHRQRGRELFSDHFDSERPLATAWDNRAPGDAAPAGTPPITLDSQTAPGAVVSNGTLRIIESGSAGDRAISTRQTFDWTPNEPGGWIQATFDLVAGGDTAPYVGYFIALRDFNDASQSPGGNVLLDGAAAGQAAIHVDYPGAGDEARGKIGHSGYTPGRNYGVRVTTVGNGKFELRQVVDGVPEEGAVTLNAADLPDGGFGFEYCCGRSFVVDNVVIEEGVPTKELSGEARVLAEQIEKQRKDLDAAIKELEASKPRPVGRLAAVSEPAAERPKVHLLNRGEYKSPGEEVLAGAPHVLSQPHSEAGKPMADATLSTTGQRLALARWITEPNSRAAALLARVTVNRWWQHHFGAGLVSTVDNLGYSGTAPSHGELLDYLAAEFVRQGWSAKAIHRMILHSAVYRQTSQPSSDTERLDPDRRLLSRYPFRRLDGEAIRDAMLAVSGELDLQRFGPYMPTQRSGAGEVVVAENTPGALRRSVYLQQRRSQVMGMLEVFDAPSIVFNCAARTRTTIPLQSLELLNSAFVRARATSFARQVQPMAASEIDIALVRAFRTAWGRRPTDEELSSARQFLAAQPEKYAGQTNAPELAWTDFCQSLVASSPFLYVE